MSLLILQIIIKQWDKGQRTDLHISERARRPDKYPVIVPPAFYALNQQCVIDQHGDDVQGGRLKYSQTEEGKIKLDRFQVDLNSKVLEYFDTPEADKNSKEIGSLDNNWNQCKYNWRYSILENEMYYWLYEEVTLNAISSNTINENVFLNSEPAIVYEDLNL
jgi:hypothetical protein